MNLKLHIYNADENGDAEYARSQGALYETRSTIDGLEIPACCGDMIEILEAASECLGMGKLAGAIITDKGGVVELTDLYDNHPFNMEYTLDELAQKNKK